MEQIKLNYENGEKIIEKVKKIVLDMYPIVEDRLDILFSHPTPTMNIQLCLYVDEEKNLTYTNIYFLNGNQNFKSQMPDRININKLISIDTLNGIIEFILSDHNFVSEFSKFNDTIHLKFVVNMRDDNMHGISCGDIELEVILSKFPYQNEFPSKKEVLDYYMKGILNRFHQNLKNTETYKKEYKKHIALEKAQIINFLTEEELHLFLGKLTIEDICSLLLTLPDDRFREIYDDLEQEKQQKKLVRQIEEKRTK